MVPRGHHTQGRKAAPPGPPIPRKGPPAACQCQIWWLYIIGRWPADPTTHRPFKQASLHVRYGISTMIPPVTYMGQYRSRGGANNGVVAPFGHLSFLLVRNYARKRLRGMHIIEVSSVFKKALLKERAKINFPSVHGRQGIEWLGKGKAPYLLTYPHPSRAPMQTCKASPGSGWWWSWAFSTCWQEKEELITLQFGHRAALVVLSFFPPLLPFFCQQYMLGFCGFRMVMIMGFLNVRKNNLLHCN